MMAGRGVGLTAAGGPARHIPVMLSEVIEALEPRDGKHFIDGTFGAGGYTRGLLEAARCSVLAIDRDPDAAKFAQALEERFPGRLKFVLGRYAEMREIAEREGIAAIDGVALDLGVSSMQLDEPERGFSFSQDGPLDMRMGAEGLTASDLVNTLPERDLAAILSTLGEEKRARVDRPRHCGAPGRGADHCGPASLPTLSPACSAAGMTIPSTRRRAPSRRSASISMRSCSSSLAA